MSCRLIIAAFSSSGLCAGGDSLKREQERLIPRMRSLLEARGLIIDRLEPLDRSGCFAILIYAQAGECESLNLLGLRRDLTQDAATLGLQLRVQREDLFQAMHRL